MISQAAPGHWITMLHNWESGRKLSMIPIPTLSKGIHGLSSFQPPQVAAKFQYFWTFIHFLTFNSLWHTPRHDSFHTFPQKSHFCNNKVLLDFSVILKVPFLLWKVTEGSGVQASHLSSYMVLYIQDRAIKYKISVKATLCKMCFFV